MNNKLISFAAAAATLFAMSACNKDANQIDVVTPGTGTYAKVSISMGTPGTRATAGEGENEFDAGSPTEAQVNSIMLVVYDTNGEVVGYGSTADINDSKRTTGNVSDTYEQVIELTMMPGKSKENAESVVAYINVANELLALSKAMEETTDDIGKLGEFVMTNAANGDDKKWSVATEIDSESLYSSPEAANAPGAKSTTIYVERLAAKVKVALNTSEEVITKPEINIVDVDGEAYELDFDANNAVWAPTGTAPEMYKLKNQWTEELAWANAVAADIKDTRNFWAKGYYYGLIDDESPDFTGTLAYVSSNELRRTEKTKGIKMGEAGYTTEHTYGNDVVSHPDYNALGAATSAIVLGKYEVNGKNADEYFKKGNDYDFYLLLNTVGGTESYTILNEEQLKEYLVKRNPIKVYVESESGEGYDEIDINEYFKVEWNKTTKKYELVLIDSNNASKLFKDGEGGKEPFNAAEDFLGTNARHYNLGYAYFYAPIEHLGEKGKVGQYGVVRNHSYELTVNSIKSLGAPLDDDHFGADPNNPGEDDPGDKPIVPDPEEAALIKADLKVLSWHVVSQGVDL